MYTPPSNDPKNITQDMLRAGSYDGPPGGVDWRSRRILVQNAALLENIVETDRVGNNPQEEHRRLSELIENMRQTDAETGVGHASTQRGNKDQGLITGRESINAHYAELQKKLNEEYANGRNPDALELAKVILRSSPVNGNGLSDAVASKSMKNYGISDKL